VYTVLPLITVVVYVLAVSGTRRQKVDQKRIARFGIFCLIGSNFFVVLDLGLLQLLSRCVLLISVAFLKF